MVVAETGSRLANRPQQWTKGQSGNPNGRPRVLREWIEQCRGWMDLRGWPALEAIATADPDSRTRLEAIKLIAGYAYGKPPQKLTIDTDEGLGQTVIEVIHVSAAEQRARLEQAQVALPAESETE